MDLTTGIILASGSGERFGANIPKQFLKLNGKMVIEYSISAMRDSGLVDHIVLVCHPDWEDVAKNLNVDSVVLGGASRNESTWNGLQACPEGTERVLIHDAVRPFLDKAIIQRCVEALAIWPAVDTCIPSADTIVEIEEEEGEERVVNIPPRHCLRRGQTPQAFDYQSIVSAYRYTKKRDATDDISLAMNFGLKCGAVEGSVWNMKITEPQDLFIAERLMQYRDVITHTPDVKGKKILLFGASGGIGEEIAKLLKELGAEVVAPSRQEADLSATELPSHLFDTNWDCIIHSAGFITPGMSIADFDKIFAINLRSALLVADLAEKTMPEGGNVIYVGSSSAMKGRAGFPLYSASKAALNNFTEAMAERNYDKKIWFTCVNPGQTLTQMLSEANLPYDSSRALSAEFVARAIISYCDTEQTGEIVNIRKNVDGAL